MRLPQQKSMGLRCGTIWNCDDGCALPWRSRKRISFDRRTRDLDSVGLLSKTGWPDEFDRPPVCANKLGREIDEKLAGENCDCITS